MFLKTFGRKEVSPMPTPPIRTITLGLADPHPLTSEAIQQASTILKRANDRYTESGYEVQTVRLSTRSIFDDLADWSSMYKIFNGC